MSTLVATTEPDAVRAGDTIKWRREDLSGDYPATTWTLKYRFRHPTNSGFEVIAAADGVDHAVTVAAATSSAWTAGRYQWAAWVESGSEKYTIGQGVMEVEPDYRTANAAGVLDDRSHARIVLEAIQAVLEGRATKDQEEYSIGDRQLKRTPIADLLVLRDRYRAEAAAEDVAQKIDSNMGGARRLLVRL